MVLTDLPIALSNLQQLVKINTLDSKDKASNLGKLYCANLEWGKSQTDSFKEAFIEENDRSPTPEVILLSDVLYAGDFPNTLRLVQTIS